MEESSSRARALSRTALPLAGAILLLVLAVRWVTTNPSLPLLAGGPGPWIVYARAGHPMPHRVVELPTSFVRTFQVATVPARAQLRLRAFRSAVVHVNGAPVALSGSGSWRSERSADVAELLRAGTNRIEVEAANDSGPPALSLALELPDGALETDERWEASWAGATPGPAALATDAATGERADPSRQVPSAAGGVLAEWRLLLAFAVLSLGIGVIATRSPGAAWRGARGEWTLAVAYGVVALLWIALFVNDARTVPLRTGFDAEAHVEYIQYLLERRAVPMADEGWQMFQPPLYYALAALGLTATGAAAGGPATAWVFRGLGLLTGLAHLAAVALGLRLLLPGRVRAQVLGLLVAGFLPCMLTMHQLVGNEPLAAALCGGALVAALHALRDPPRLFRDVAIGALMGLALLAKVSALLIVPPVLGALGAVAIRRAPERRRRWLGLAIVATVTVAVCGWYYALVWQRFGTPLVGGWDPRRGFAWWQDPGYRTLADFTRFGRALVHPVYAGFASFWDGLYSTLWADGLLSGRADLNVVPYVWSPSLMAAGLALAVVPCAALLAGGAAAIVGFARRPSPQAGMLLVLAALVFAALAWMALEVPSAASIKATYGLLALLALAAFVARALDAAAGWGRWAAVAVVTALGTWALTSYASIWIPASSARADTIRAAALAGAVPPEDHARALAEVVQRHPQDLSARLLLADAGLRSGMPLPYVAALTGRDEPDLPPLAHELRSVIAQLAGDAATAVTEVRRALARDPGNVLARARLAAVLEQQGHLGEARDAWREVLRADPQREDAHRALAALYARTGDDAAAARHAAWAARLAR